MSEAIQPKDVIVDPILFLKLRNDSMDRYVDEVLRVGTEQWNERNPVGTVSGSSAAKCTRLAYYRYKEGGDMTDPATWSKRTSKNTLAIGHKYEALIGERLGDMPIGTMKLYYEQNEPPVNLQMDIDGVRFGSTTDHVIELTDGVSHHIPHECKSKEPYRGWDWDGFDYARTHFRQILLWIYLAKQSGYNVPYGVLHYGRKRDWDSKDTIILVDQKTLNYLPDNVYRVDYDDVVPMIDQRVRQLADEIRNGILPDVTISSDKSGRTIRNGLDWWECDSCYFKRQCWANMNTGETGG